MSSLQSNSNWGEPGRANASLLQNLHVDWPLLAGILILTMVGLAVQYSASGQEWPVVVRQMVMLTIAFITMLGVSQISPRHIELWTPWVYGLGIVFLISVILFGDTGKGAQRWLDLGLFRFQPSEIMKVAVPMMVAWYLSQKSLPPSPITMLVTLLIIIVPFALIIKQPDLGTALLVGSAGIFALFLTGISWGLILGFFALLAAIAPIAWFYGMHDYQRQRVLTFINPENDPLGAGYHIIQSKIAIGSGGVYGKGWLNGTQSQLDFLPERSTDFIFAVFAEEFGLIGVLLLLTLYLYIIFRGLTIAYQAQDVFTRLLSGSLILTFFVYILVNIGMVSGLLPVVGVPLPLISYGGTSMVTLMAAFGLIMSIQTHRKLLTS